MEEKEWICRYCGKPTHVKYSTICGGCYPKLKLIREIKARLIAAKRGAK